MKNPGYELLLLNIKKKQLAHIILFAQNIGIRFKFLPGAFLEHCRVHFRVFSGGGGQIAKHSAFSLIIITILNVCSNFHLG